MRFKSLFAKIHSYTVSQLHTALTPVNLVHFAFLIISHKMYYFRNVPGVLGILTILGHTYSRLAIQYS